MGANNLRIANIVTKLAVWTTEKVVKDNAGIFGDPKETITSPQFRDLLETIVINKLKNKFSTGGQND